MLNERKYELLFLTTRQRMRTQKRSEPSGAPVRWDGYVNGKLVCHLYSQLGVDRWKEQNPKGEIKIPKPGE